MNKEDFAAIVSGDKQAFERMFKEYYPPLCLFAISRVRNAEAAREIVQELFCFLWEHRQQMTIQSSLSGYLYRSVHNACLNYLKHQNIVGRTRELVADSITYLPFQPDEFAEEAELQAALIKALDSMPEKTRQIFEMVRFDGKKYMEVAGALDISVKTVEAHMGAALRHLRSALGYFLRR